MKKASMIIAGIIVAFLTAGSPAPAEEPDKSQKEDKAELKPIVVTPTGKIEDESILKVPAVVETITPESIERINAIDTSDIFKYMPGSYLRWVYPGSTNRPFIIRGMSTVQTPRINVFADGIQLSDFTAAGNSNGPKWQMVVPLEIERAEVIYGPFSAALSGNSMAGTVMITTRFPQKWENQADFTYWYEHFRQYNTDEDIQGYTGTALTGGKIKRFSFMVWYNRLDTNVAPITYNTAQIASGKAGAGSPVNGWLSDLDPQGNGRYIFGSAGVSSMTNDTVKVKVSYDLTSESKLHLIWSVWDMHQNSMSPETYLTNAQGNQVYSGPVVINGKTYSLAANTFTYSMVEKQDLLYALGYTLNSASGLKVLSNVSWYDLAKDITRTSSTTPPLSQYGGPGTVSDNNNGWYNADLKTSYPLKWSGAQHTLGAGYHFDSYYVDANTWNASDWRSYTKASLKERDQGKTQTQALFLDDTWDISKQWSIYMGGRYEWWKGFDGAKSSQGTSGLVRTPLTDKSQGDFSPKFSTAFKPDDNWRLRYSLGIANRYPTVGELYYGGITAQGILNNVNPNLKPERSFSQDFTITRNLNNAGEARLTFFEDDVTNSIYSQTNYYTNVTNYQNIDDVRIRGIEGAVNIRKLFIRGLGLFTNVAWTDAEIIRNANVPASVGKEFPRVPRWRVKSVLDYSPSDRWFATVSMHYASREYSQLDNSDTHSGYGAADEFMVFDAKFGYRINKEFMASIGCDNITDRLYHISHPYPRRTLFANLKYLF